MNIRFFVFIWSENLGGRWAIKVVHRQDVCEQILAMDGGYLRLDFYSSYAIKFSPNEYINEYLYACIHFSIEYNNYLPAIVAAIPFII